MSFLSQIPYAALVGLTYVTMLMVLVAAHELGHYLFARLFGMGAEEFSVGMFGKRPLLVLGKRRYTIALQPGEDPNYRGEINPLEGGNATEPTEVVETPRGTLLKETTVFTIRPWPIGGFVRIKGMMPQEDGGETRIPGGFFSKAPWKRWVVLAAGPAFSMLAGVLLLIPYLTCYGLPKATTAFKEVAKDGAAYAAGLRGGDRVTSVDGKPVQTGFDLVRSIRDTGGRPILLTVDRSGRSFTVTVAGKVESKPSPVADEDGVPTGVYRRQTRLGVLMDQENAPVPLGRALTTAIKIPFFAAVDFADRVLHPAQLVESVGGPGTMIKATSDSIQEGVWPVVRLAGLLSISVGIFNLLPIPPLDGGQMWIAFVEMLRRGRRLSMRTQVRVLNVGFAMVAALIVGVLLIDARRLTGLDGSSKPAPAKSAKP